jgi:hypothetical protein
MWKESTLDWFQLTYWHFFEESKKTHDEVQNNHDVWGSYDGNHKYYSPLGCKALCFSKEVSDYIPHNYRLTGRDLNMESFEYVEGNANNSKANYCFHVRFNMSGSTKV